MRSRTTNELEVLPMPFMSQFAWSIAKQAAKATKNHRPQPGGIAFDVPIIAYRCRGQHREDNAETNIAPGQSQRHASLDHTLSKACPWQKLASHPHAIVG